MTAPSVSLELVICTYNNAPSLNRTLQAIARQRVSPDVRWSVLVIDNNCTDETPAVIDAHEHRPLPAPLRCVREPRQGLTPARERGVRESAADWIAFVDDDCLLAEDWVEQAARFAAAHPDCGAFGGRVILHWESGAPPPHARGYGWAFAETDHGQTEQRRDWLAGAGMVLRRSTLFDCGWVDRPYLQDRIGKRLVSGGDVEIGLRVAARAPVWYVPQCKLRHVIPARRTSRAYLRRILFGLGASGHNSGALCWRGSYAGWVAHAARRSLRLLHEGLRTSLGDLRRRREAFDPGIALAFVGGWWAAMWRMLWMPRALRREWLGAVGPSQR
jgi:glycosyltransferase involved in cell wall biosynthesis